MLIGRAEKVPGTELWLAGAEYSFARDEESFRTEKAEMVQRALQDIPKEKWGQTILLAHHPEFIDDGAEMGVPLILTGHTHGGQFSLFGWSPAALSYDEWNGMTYEGRRALYVSAGAGALIPFRLGMPREIVVITLKVRK